MLRYVMLTVIATGTESFFIIVLVAALIISRHELRWTIFVAGDTLLHFCNITKYFIYPSGKLKLLFDLIVKHNQKLNCTYIAS